MVKVSEDRLRMCFNRVEVNVQEVANMLLMLEDDSKADEGEKLLKELYDKLKAAESVDNAVGDTLRKVLDDCFVETIGSTPAVDHFGNSGSKEWAKAFHQYVQRVPAKMCEAVRQMAINCNPEDDTENLIPALRSCHIKAEVVFALQSKDNPFWTFPFMTKSAFIAIDSHLARISKSILEVCSILIQHSNCLSPCYVLCKSNVLILAPYAKLCWQSRFSNSYSGLCLVISICVFLEGAPARLASRISECRHDARSLCSPRLSTK